MIYNWSSLSNGTVFGGGGGNPPSFNPFADTLHFDDPSITAAFLIFYSPDGLSSVFSYGGKTVTLDTAPYTLSTPPATTSVTLVPGNGIFIYGDGTNTGASPDDGANTLIGGSGDDFLAGGGGADSVFGGDGNDFLAVSGDTLTQAFGNDILNGGAGRGDFFGYIQSVAGATVNLGNETANGSAAGGDAPIGGSVLTLIGIEGVFGTDFADTLNANSATTVTGRVNTDIVQFIEGAGGSDTINGAVGDGRLTVLSYQFDPGAVTVDGGNGTASDGYGGMDIFTNIDAVIGSAFNDVIGSGAAFSNSSDEVLQFFEGMAGNDMLGGSRAAYDHSPFGVVVNLSETAISGNFYGAGVITVNSKTARDGWDSLGGGTDTIGGIDARGSRFNDTLIGSDDEDNWFEGGGGNDYIDGRGGIDDHEDTVEYIHATGAVYVNLGLGTGQGIGGDNGVGVDTLVNIEDVRGSDFDDLLVGGGPGFSTLYHVEGFDGRAGNDTLDGGDTNPDTLDFAWYESDPSAVIVNLSSSSITVNGIVVAARTARDGYGVSGHPTGIDTLVNIDSATGSRFDDYLRGGDGDNWFQPLRGNDTIVGGAGSDTVIFDGPDDVFVGVTVNLATGFAMDATGGSDTLVGIENVVGTYHADRITGDDNDNVFEGDGGNDTLDGGAGSDTALYQWEQVTADLAAGMASDGMGGIDKLISIENLVGSEFDDNLQGSSFANVLDGGAGDDTLIGRGGHDTLIGGAGGDTLDGGVGNDRLIGGTGNDTYFVDSTGDRVIEAAGGGNDTVITSVGILLPANVENIIFTGTASVVITGTSQNNIIAGGASDDTLSGGTGIDTVSYARATAPVVIDLEANIATGQGTDVLSGFENATGGRAADRLIGNSANNVLDGSGGADTMTGGFGNDTYHVDRATDKVIETSNSVPGALLLPGGDPGAGPAFAGVSGITDTVVAAINYSLGTSALRYIENLTLSGSALRGTGNALANKLTGNDGDNILNGAGGNDVLNGGAGNDSLNGGAGNDKLNGGAGDDILIWGSTDTHDGAAGTDTLKVLSDNLDLTAVLNSRIKNIEQIDMTGGNNNTLTLNADEVLAISSTSDTLTVLGNPGDVVSAAGFVQGADSGGFRTYTSGLATLLVDTGITIV